MRSWVRDVTRGLVLASVLLASQASAQSPDDLTADEIRRALESQRGLKFEPVGDDEPDDDDAGSDYVELPVDEQLNVRIRFDFDSAVIRADQEALLGALCDGVRTADVGRIRIVGHTDASGPEAYNAGLSRLRAEEVRRHLVERCGIDASRLEAIGVGEEHLLDGVDPRGDENRRVEFQRLS